MIGRYSTRGVAKRRVRGRTRERGGGVALVLFAPPQASRPTAHRRRGCQNGQIALRQATGRCDWATREPLGMTIGRGWGGAPALGAWRLALSPVARSGSGYRREKGLCGKVGTAPWGGEPTPNSWRHRRATATLLHYEWENRLKITVVLGCRGLGEPMRLLTNTSPNPPRGGEGPLSEGGGAGRVAKGGGEGWG